MTPIGWSMALVWARRRAWFAATDQIERLAYRLLRGGVD